MIRGTTQSSDQWSRGGAWVCGRGGGVVGGVRGL